MQDLESFFAVDIDKGVLVNSVDRNSAASKAGDISQDLKTGHLVGATPSVQQIGQYVGAATACWAWAGPRPSAPRCSGVAG